MRRYKTISDLGVYKYFECRVLLFKKAHMKRSAQDSPTPATLGRCCVQTWLGTSWGAQVLCVWHEFGS